MKQNIRNDIQVDNLDKTILDQIPAMVFAMDTEYNLILINESGRKWSGKKTEDLLGTKCYDFFRTPLCKTSECPIHRAMKSGETVKGQTEKKNDDSMNIIEFVTSPLYDEKGDIFGGVEYIVDITDKINTENKARQLQEDLMELSTPVLSLWEDILVTPLIGTLDSRRTHDVIEKSLSKMSEEKAKVLVVDITGVPLVDTMVANHLIKLAEAVKLMGGICILTGISPLTAKTIVHLGIDLSRLNTRSTLAHGLDLALSITDKGRK